MMVNPGSRTWLTCVPGSSDVMAIQTQELGSERCVGFLAARGQGWEKLCHPQGTPPPVRDRLCSPFVEQGLHITLMLVLLNKNLGKNAPNPYLGTQGAWEDWSAGFFPLHLWCPPHPWLPAPLPSLGLLNLKVGRPGT